MGIDADRVLIALGNWERCISTPQYGRGGFQSLVSALSCYAESIEAQDGKGEALTKRVWLTVFEMHCTSTEDPGREYDLLVGLFTNERYLTLFAKVGTAHAFVHLAVKYVETRSSRWSAAYREDIRLRLAMSLSEWIAPDWYIGTTSLRAIAVALFGEPWCSLVYDSRGPRESLAGLIEATRPEFLLGRVGSDVEHASAVLPDMTSC
jgi:hypothetical protein